MIKPPLGFEFAEGTASTRVNTIKHDCLGEYANEKRNQKIFLDMISGYLDERGTNEALSELSVLVLMKKTGKLKTASLPCHSDLLTMF